MCFLPLACLLQPDYTSQQGVKFVVGLLQRAEAGQMSAVLFGRAVIPAAKATGFGIIDLMAVQRLLTIQIGPDPAFPGQVCSPGLTDSNVASLPSWN